MGKELTVENSVARRKVLGEILPLQMPLVLTINVTNLCNFKCFYCPVSESIEKRKSYGMILQHMPYHDYQKCIDSIGKAGEVNLLTLCGWGEPLLHPDIVDMVRYAKDKHVGKTVRIISNGSLLTREMADALIAAGLDDIRISLQGLDAKAYKETSNVNLDFEQFIDNIRYFYEHRGNTHISFRIMDNMIKNREDEFLEKFAAICDEYEIGCLTEMLEGLDYSKGGTELNKTFYGENIIKTSICSVPFFRGYIDVDSRMIPCCMLPLPLKLGDVREDFYSVWNGEERICFLIDLLQGEKEKYHACRHCNMYCTQVTSKDRLDDYRDELIQKHESLLGRDLLKG